MSENINTRISIDYESVCAGIENILKDVDSLCAERYLARALGDAVIRNVRDRGEAVRKRLYGTFQLVIIGDFKRGKSTLINAMLGEAAVPTAVTPETVTINRLSFGETLRTEAILKNKKRVSLSQSELSREALEEIVKDLPAPVDMIDIRLNHELLRDISVIDTPGMGDLMKSFDEQVADYLVNADAVIYVISARSPLSYTEQTFLSSTVMPQSFSRIFLAVNMADTLETEENLQKMKTLVESRAEAISDKIYVQVLSALDEYCRKQELPRPAPQLAQVLEDNFLEFETALQNDVFLQKDVIKSARGVALTRGLLGEIDARIRLVQNSLRAGVEKLERCEGSFQDQDQLLHRSIEKHKESISGDIQEMKEEARNWLREFLERLKGEIEQLGGTAPVSDIQRYFQFYLMDSIKAAILSCTQRHQKEIGDRLSDSAKSISGELSQTIFGSIQTQIAECIADISWTNVDTAMFAGDVALSMSGLSGVLGPLYVVGQAVAGVVRQKTLSHRQADMTAPVLQAFHTIVSGVIESVDTIYGQMKKNALSKLDELYQNQVEASSEAIRNARQIAADESMKVQDAQDALDDALRVSASCMEQLREYD